MYNRYIPQPDGSYSRRQVQEKLPPPPAPKACSTEKENNSPKEPPKEQPMEPDCQEKPQSPPCKRCPQQSAGSFLRNLLPKDFDTGDLLIILLILIMAGDSEEGQNNALLTLALYLFM